LQLFFQVLVPSARHCTELLTPVMMDGIEQDRKEPRPTIGSALEAVEGLPRLEKDFLHYVLGGRLLTQQPPRGSKEVIQMRHCNCLKFLGPRLLKKQHEHPQAEKRRVLVETPVARGAGRL